MLEIPVVGCAALQSVAKEREEEARGRNLCLPVLINSIECRPGFITPSIDRIRSYPINRPEEEEDGRLVARYQIGTWGNNVFRKVVKDDYQFNSELKKITITPSKRPTPILDKEGRLTMDSNLFSLTLET